VYAGFFRKYQFSPSLPQKLSWISVETTSYLENKAVRRTKNWFRKALWLFGLDAFDFQWIFACYSWRLTYRAANIHASSARLFAFHALRIPCNRACALARKQQAGSTFSPLAFLSSSPFKKKTLLADLWGVNSAERTLLGSMRLRRLCATRSTITSVYCRAPRINWLERESYSLSK
jgi:hypothetical protein